MSRTWRDYLILGFVLAVGLPRVGTTVMAGPDERDLRITLHVYNYAHVTEKRWLEAKKQATAIFRKAGVETVWRHVPLSPENRTSVNQIQPPSFNSSPLHLRIYLIPRSRAKRMEERLGLAKDNVFGLTPRTPDGRPGRLAYVFYHRIREFVVERTIFEQEALLLGLAIAHEIGHLLLPHNSHSRSGIMRARWDRQDLRFAAADLVFTAQQAKSIQIEVARRLKEQEESKKGEYKVIKPSYFMLIQKERPLGEEPNDTPETHR
jgi:hypothetical protein